MENIYVGLDIGTTKVCAIVASLSENGEVNILGIGKSKSEGLTRGVITHIEKTIASIQAAVREAELQSGAKIQHRCRRDRGGPCPEFSEPRRYRDQRAGSGNHAGRRGPPY